MKRPYVPLSMNDLVTHQQNRVLIPSPWIIAQYRPRFGTRQLSSDESNLQRDSHQYDEYIPTKPDNLPPEVRALLDNLIKKYGTVEENIGISAIHYLNESLSVDDVAKLIENAVEAVQRFDIENNIGDRKLQKKKTIKSRLLEFFKYAGRHGVRLNNCIKKLFFDINSSVTGTSAG